MLLLLDNYDSFTYNLYQYLSELGADVLVRRNDELTVEEVERLSPSHIVISPGPCTPREAGISNALIERLGPRIPLLGVCLGHQCIGAVFGGRVIRASEPVHGKTSLIHHDERDLFAGLPNPFEAIRYHSLIVERETLPDMLAITATVGDASSTSVGPSAGHPSSHLPSGEAPPAAGAQEVHAGAGIRGMPTEGGRRRWDGAPAVGGRRRADEGLGVRSPLIMGLRHRVHPIYGVQFHPESILTSVGKDLLRNFLSMAASRPASLTASVGTLA